MKRCLSLLLLSSGLLFSRSNADVSFPSPTGEQQMVIHNRILAKAGNKTISVLDVVKQMEVFLNRYYPQYADSVPAKYQYFSAQWKATLLQMIDHELILTDAEKLELKITDAEVRETLLEKFGPNLMASLDKLGLSYEEARSMIHSELVVQKMTWFKIHSKALHSVNTQDVKQAYARFCEKNPAKEIWDYRVLSVRAKSEELARQIAQKAYELCKMTPSTISSITENLKELFPSDSEEDLFTVSLSEELKTEDKSLSVLHKDTLKQLALNSLSVPVKHSVRNNQGTVYRIFYLQNHTKISPPSLRSLYEKLQEQLVQEAANQESEHYMTRLRERYGFDAKTLDETIPVGFQPFSLQ